MAALRTALAITNVNVMSAILLLYILESKKSDKRGKIHALDSFNLLMLEFLIMGFLSHSVIEYMKKLLARRVMSLPFTC